MGKWRQGCFPSGKRSPRIGLGYASRSRAEAGVASLVDRASGCRLQCQIVAVEANIVRHMRAAGCGRSRPMSLAALGEAGFTGYRFNRPQGAALAVSGIVCGMIDRGILRQHVGGRGYYLVELG